MKRLHVLLLAAAALSLTPAHAQQRLPLDVLIPQLERIVDRHLAVERRGALARRRGQRQAVNRNEVIRDAA